MSKKRVDFGVAAVAVSADQGVLEVATKTKLQAFAEEVAASHLGIDVDKVAKAFAEPDSASSLGYLDPNVAERLRRMAFPGRPFMYENPIRVMFLDFTGSEVRRSRGPSRCLLRKTAWKGRPTLRSMQLWGQLPRNTRT